MSSSISILIADDQTLMRDGLKTILDLEDDLNVIGTASNGKEAYNLALQLKPDVLLMDIRMPVVNGVEATKLIKQELEGVIVIILTTFDDDDFILDAIRYGASGYILKETDYDSLIQSIRDIYSGKFILPTKIASKFVKSIFDVRNMNDSNKAVFYDFTNKEVEICKLICEGYSNQDIGNTLFLSKGTVKNYVSKIYNKIGVNNRTAAILFLQKVGY